MGLGHAAAELGDGDLERERVPGLDDTTEAAAVDAGEEPDLDVAWNGLRERPAFFFSPSGRAAETSSMKTCPFSRTSQGAPSIVM